MVAFILLLAVTVMAAEDLTSNPDEESLGRETRGLLLRSWRNAQQPAKMDQKANKPEALLSPGPLHRISSQTSNLLAGLPVSMKLVLLQRLTGHDKRTPNNKAFLGMRGKKNFYPSSQEEDSVADYYPSEWADDEGSVQEDQSYPRAKKMRPSGLDRERQLQALFDQGGSKRAPSANSFMGMRGKRSDWTKGDYPAEDELDWTRTSNWRAADTLPRLDTLFSRLS